MSFWNTVTIRLDSITLEKLNRRFTGGPGDVSRFIRELVEDYLKDSLRCFLDGNELCICGDDFVNLQVSDVMFVPLSKEKLTEYKQLENSLR